MPVTLRAAPAVQRVAEKLIADHYPLIIESGARIEYLFRSEPAKLKGRQVHGTCKKQGGVAAVLCQEGGVSEEPVEAKDCAFYVIEIAEPVWNRMTDAQRAALTDHELAHILIMGDDEEGWSLQMQAHDLEEFAAVIARHGVWDPGIEWFLREAGDALQLPFGETPT